MRKLSCCIALVMILSITGAAFAQPSMPVPCGGLSDADCEILTNVQAASQTIDSALFDLSFNVNVSDIPGMSDPLTLGVTGSGSVSGLGALHDMAGMADMTDMAALEEHMGEIVSSVLAGFNGDLNLTINLPEALMGSSEDMPSSVTIQARMVDGFAYLNADTLAPLMANSDMNLSGWYGVDLVGLVGAVMEQMPSGMFDSSMMMQSDAMMDYMAAISDPEFINSFISVERTDDGSGDTAVFVFDFDFAALMSSQAFQNLMQAQMEMQTQMTGAPLDEEAMGEAMAVASQMLKGITMTMTEEIGLEDGFMHSVSAAMNIDTTNMMAIMGEAMGSSSSSTEAAPTIAVDFALNFSSINSAPEISAPEDATIIPFESLLSRMGNMGGMSGMSGATPVPALEMTPTATPAS